jgi:hypothetical protein
MAAYGIVRMIDGDEREYEEGFDTLAEAEDEAAH